MEYANHRHNIGFDVHAFAMKHAGIFKESRLAYMTEVKWKVEFFCVFAQLLT
jgi:peptidyl-tRNA hydrolase